MEDFEVTDIMPVVIFISSNPWDDSFIMLRVYLQREAKGIVGTYYQVVP